MKILNRAKSIYSDEYLISEDIKFELGLMYLRINNKWRECDKDTRSLNFENMIDSQGNKIFASLNEDGKGGDILYYEDDCQPYICEHSSDGTFLFEYLDDKTIKNYICRLSGNKVLFEDLKVIGIQE